MQQIIFQRASLLGWGAPKLVPSRVKSLGLMHRQETSTPAGSLQVCRVAAAPQSQPAPPPPSAAVEKNPELSELGLKQLDPSGTKKFDLVIAGGGPSGLAVADRVSEAGFKVCIVDPMPLANWPNNYGVWVDEFEMMGLEDCLEVVWSRIVVEFQEKPEDDRFKPVCGDGTDVVGTLVLDATGHARRLVEFDKKFDPGYQGAYGVLIEVESHSYDLDTMVFMDWRDDHLDDYPELKAKNMKLPTFLYVMPFSPTKIFLEETSLVARPAISFEDLKERLKVRMDWLGLKVKSVEEEECCLIPMGGELPKYPQRVLGIGGTAGMVHPATGYMVSRMLGVAPTLADSITEQLSYPRDKAVYEGSKHTPLTEEEAAQAARAVWESIWPLQRIWQREFFWFGMEVVLKLNVQETRAFFASFFSLSNFHWQGFLSSRLSFPELLVFGWALFLKADNETRVKLLTKGAPGLAVMISRLAMTLINRK